eukprot:1373648-Amorphochlora_amoeboformis.AAC.1
MGSGLGFGMDIERSPKTKRLGSDGDLRKSSEAKSLDSGLGSGMGSGMGSGQGSGGVGGGKRDVYMDLTEDTPRGKAGRRADE